MYFSKSNMKTEEMPEYLVELEKVKELYKEYLKINSIFNIRTFTEKEEEPTHLITYTSLQDMEFYYT